MVAIFRCVQRMTTTETITQGIQPCHAGTSPAGARAPGPGALVAARAIAYCASAFGDQSLRNAKVTRSEASAASTSVSE